MIQPVGPIPAKIMLVGEAPGEQEEKAGVPFVGMAGKLLDSLLEGAGIRREECYITNVMLERPAGNKFSNFYVKEKGKRSPSAALVEGRARLLTEIARVQPCVIVPMGNEAMLAILGMSGVVDWRGSCLDSPMGKVIPTIHPASILRHWTYLPAVQNDFIRIKGEAATPEFYRTHRELVVCYDFNQAVEELKGVLNAKEVAFDIETESAQVTAIGFSHQLHRAITIPLWFAGSGSRFDIQQETLLWELITSILCSPGIRSMAHNGVFDIEHLRRVHGISVTNYALDTMLAFHTVYPELPKGLDYLCSIYTDMPYYKHMGGSDNMDDFYRYNAMDACVTFEIAQELKVEMKDFGVEGFYYEHVHPMVEPIVAMQLKGVRFDHEERLRMKKAYKDIIKDMQSELELLVGHELNVGSHKQMCEWLYTELKLTKQTSRNKETGVVGLTADDGALEELYEKFPRREIELVREIRAKNKIVSTYLEVKLDPDGRVRCSYNLAGTETGRLSSSQTVTGTGMNLQNVPEEVKHLFLADEGMVLINADLSQAEARIVAYVSWEQRLIDIFNNGGDVHRRNAANIFRKPESEVTANERQLAKRVIHACLTGDHEVLTESGRWVRLDAYDGKEAMAVWSTLGEITFEVPLRIYNYPPTDDLVSLEGTSISALCTSNHAFPVISKDSVYNRTYIVKRSVDTFPKNGRIPLTGIFHGNGYLNLVSLQLMVAIQADGCICKKGYVSFNLRKERKISRLDNLLVNIKHTKKVYEERTCYYIPRKAITHITSLLLPGKTFNSKLLLNLTLKLRKDFLQEVVLWDGESNEVSGRQTSYFSTNKENAQLVQTIAHVSGIEAIFRKAVSRPNRKSLYLVHFNRRKFARIECLRIHKSTECKPVYCVETSTGYFLTRRNNYVYGTSNSNYGMGPVTFSRNAGITIQEAKSLLNKYFATFPRIKVWHMQMASSLKRTRTLVTPFGRKRVFYNKWDESVLKEGLAYIPQSTVADLVNQAIVELSGDESFRRLGIDILMQVHDSIVVQCPVESVDATVPLMRCAMSRPVVIGGRELKIPTDFKVGPNWGSMEKYVTKINAASISKTEGAAA
jgi:uracil-DNA glycosylase family 4